jgi:hypothetical protein
VQPVAVRSDRLVEGVRSRGDANLRDCSSLGIENANRQSSGVQIDATIQSVLLSAEAHHDLLGPGGGEPARVVGVVHPPLKMPRWDKVRLDPDTHWDRSGHPTRP